MENKEVYIAFTPKGDTAFIFSAKNDRTMAVSRMTLNPEHYSFFEFYGDYQVITSEELHSKDYSLEFKKIEEKIKHRATILNLLVEEIKAHLSGGIDTSVQFDNQEGMVESIRRLEVDEDFNNHRFWVDALWMRVFRMTQTDLYLLLSYDMEYHCAGTGGKTIFNPPLSFEDRVATMFARTTGQYKSTYGALDDYYHFIRPFQERMSNIINACYTTIDLAINEGKSMNDVVNSPYFQEGVFYSDYLIYVQKILPKYADKKAFTHLNYQLIDKYKNVFLKELPVARYALGATTLATLSSIFETLPYPFVKKVYNENHTSFYFERENEDRVAL